MCHSIGWAFILLPRPCHTFMENIPAQTKLTTSRGHKDHPPICLEMTIFCNGVKIWGKNLQHSRVLLFLLQWCKHTFHSVGWAVDLSPRPCHTLHWKPDLSKIRFERKVKKVMKVKKKKCYSHCFNCIHFSLRRLEPYQRHNPHWGFPVEKWKKKILNWKLCTNLIFHTEQIWPNGGTSSCHLQKFPKHPLTI